ncbi:MAG: response regulator transcription factor [Chloroflexi bacterium]|nr:response regulator transcription factor [Chloroflexota bacterium]
MSEIKVLLADDHAVVRSGLRMLLEAEGDIEVVGEARDGLEAIRKAEQLTPDVILMDISMPGLSGLEAARRIKKERPQINILFLTMHQSEEYFFQALQAGGSGYVPKSALDTEVIAAVRTVSRGLSYLHPSVSQMLVADYVERAKAGEKLDPYESLTDREKEILHLIAAGHSNKEIAEKLSISINTVHNHRANLMEKLGLHNRMELLKYAIRKGLVEKEG